MKHNTDEEKLKDKIRKELQEVGTYEREFYQCVAEKLTLQRMIIELKHFTLFYNTKRLHFALKYDTTTKNLRLLGLPIPISLTP